MPSILAAKRAGVGAILAGALCGVAAAVPASADAADARPCGRIVDPYPDTRYQGVDLTRIRATGVSCATARRVARRAHAQALGLTPPASGIRRFAWRGWEVTGDLRGASDRYVAKRNAQRVRWRF